MQVHRIGTTTESKITLSLMTQGIMTTTKDEAPLELVLEMTLRVQFVVQSSSLVTSFRCDQISELLNS
jgi:hypothetical protein